MDMSENICNSLFDFFRLTAFSLTHLICCWQRLRPGLRRLQGWECGQRTLLFSLEPANVDEQIFMLSLTFLGVCEWIFRLRIKMTHLHTPPKSFIQLPLETD